MRSKVAIQPKTLGDLLIYEAPKGYSRSDKVLQVNQLGAVVNEKGNMISLSGAAADKKPVGVACASNKIWDRQCIVRKSGLIFPDDATPEQKKTAIDELEKLGIRVRSL